MVHPLCFFPVGLHRLQSCLSFAQAVLAELADRPHMSLGGRRVIAQTPHQLLRAGMLTIPVKYGPAVIPELRAEPGHHLRVIAERQQDPSTRRRNGEPGLGTKAGLEPFLGV